MSNPDREKPSDEALARLLEASELAADLSSSGSDMHQQAENWRAKAQQGRDSEAFLLLHEGAMGLLETLDFQTLLGQVLSTAVQSLRAKRGVVFLGRSLDEEFVPAVTSGVDASEIGELGKTSKTILRRVIAGDSVLTEDALNDPELRDAVSVRAQQLRSVLCVPLRLRGELFGAIYLDDRESTSAFPRSSVQFLRAFGDLAASALDHARRHSDAIKDNERLRRQVSDGGPFSRIVTADSGMRSLMDRAQLVAQVEEPVLIFGESGTGKELLSRALHLSGPRSQRAFLAQNCAAVPDDLMESLFFGHTQGSFTGATKDRAGLLRLADQGTLFLDEIVDLAPAVQAKLLRVLETGVVRPLGSETEFHVSVRIIAAASTSLWDAVEEKKFREDLFYRLNVVELRIPPLRERRGDVPFLVDHFSKFHRDDPDKHVHFKPEALDFLMSLPWRGNVRELENLVRRALIFFAGGVVGIEEAKGLIGGNRPSPNAEDEGLPVVGASQATTDASTFPTLEQRSIAAIREALSRTDGNRTKAAELLGIHRNALLRKLKRLGID